jgi:hypothetical protein
MIRILKNKTAEDANVHYGNTTVVVETGNQRDLAETFLAWQLAACDDLVTLLAQGIDKFQLNDGVNDLTMIEAVDLVRGYPPAVQQVTAALPFPTVKPMSPKLTLITPNWCDKTTWYEGSVYVEDEMARDSGDHLRYELDQINLIDSYHGKVTFEDFLKDSSNRSYRVVVKVNGTVKTEQDPHYGTGGDYTVDYAGGVVNFLAALDPADIVLVSYHYASSATFTLRPTTGKKLVISNVEVQFSEDLVMNDSVIFQAYGLVDVFAPQLMPGIPSGTKIPLGDPLIYKTIGDLINDSNHAYPAYPAFGGAGWRATKKATYIFAWEYTVGTTMLYASMGMEIRVSLQHETPHGGAYATATFYSTSEDE